MKMKNAILLSCFLMVFFSGAIFAQTNYDTISATYVAGAIQTDDAFYELGQTSICPAVLNVPVPNNALIVGVGSTVHPCLRAAETLEKEGVSVAVIDARFIKPLDEELIFNWGNKCRLIITVEENIVAGGFGSAVLEAAAMRSADVTIQCLGLPDSFIEQGSLAELRSDLGLDTEGIISALRKMLAGDRP